MAIVRNIIYGGNGGNEIVVEANYSALPDPTTVSGQFYWCSSSQGTSWLPGSLGGTYYNSGLYYSNGTNWEFLNVPYNATQSEVNSGTNNDKFVTPNTLSNSNWAFTSAKVIATLLTGFASSAGVVTSADSILQAIQKLVGNIDLKQHKAERSNVASSSVTGTTSETIVYQKQYTGSDFVSGDGLYSLFSFLKTGTAGTATIRIRIGANGTTADTRMATYAPTATSLDFPIERKFEFLTGNNIRVMNDANNAISFVAAAAFSPTTLSLNYSNSFYYTVTVQLQNSADSVVLNDRTLQKL